MGPNRQKSRASRRCQRRLNVDPLFAEGRRSKTDPRRCALDRGARGGFFFLVAPVDDVDLVSHDEACSESVGFWVHNQIEMADEEPSPTAKNSAIRLQSIWFG